MKMILEALFYHDKNLFFATDYNGIFNISYYKDNELKIFNLLFMAVRSCQISLK